MRAESQKTWGGWRLTGLIGTGLIAMATAAYLLTPDHVAGAREVIRLTARTSLMLFLLAFTASAMERLYPSPFTRWLRENRRYLGVSFAISHFVHLAAIIALARLDYGIFLELTNLVTYVGGGLGYLLIVLMTATSFDRTAALIGPRAWHLLHAIGMWYICLSFALNFGKRVPITPLYLVPVVLIGLAGVIRFLGRRKTTAKRAAA